MSQFLATLRRHPAPLIGTFVALALAAILVSTTASLVGTGLTLHVPARRLAATAVVVTGAEQVRITSGTGDNAQTDTLALPAYRRVPADLARRLAVIPGVAAAAADISVPVALELPRGRVITGTTAAPITGHGWSSAPLTPFTLRAGHAPLSPGEVVIGAGLARAAGLTVGATVHLTGRNLPGLVVVGLAAGPRGSSGQDWTIFLTDREAGSLYGHSRQADLIGVTARPGTSPVELAARIRARLGRNYTVLAGADRGQAEDLAAAGEKLNLWQLATSAGLDVVLIALFVVAGTVALSITQRWRNIALLRAVGATPGQVRRMIAVELAILGGLAGLAGGLPGIWLAWWTMRGLARHQLVPPSAPAWTSPWVLLISIGTGVIVAQLAGFVAARRVSRISPVAALQEATIERRAPHPVRCVLGLGVLGGGAAMSAVILIVPLGLIEQVNLALAMGLAFMVAIALLGPWLVVIAELIVRLPVRAISGIGGRLALADVRVRPRRMATAVTSIALGIAFVGAIYVIDSTQAHASLAQGRQRLRADAVVSAPGPGLVPGVVPAITRQAAASAVGLTPTTIFAPYPGSENTAAVAVTPGPLAAVLDLDVLSGSLAHFGPGDIALSKLVAGRGAVSTHVGATITTYLSDGTPYRAMVTAIYGRSLGFGDALIPSAASGGGHLGSADLAEVLVRAAGHVPPARLERELSSLETRYPGLHVAARSVVNAEATQQLAQTSYANSLLLVLIALLAGLALVNTLIMATVERGASFRLLHRVGATSHQLLSMSAWQTFVLSLVGGTLGALSGGAIVVVVSRALTGSWEPYLTWPPVAAAGLTVLGLTALSTLTPTMWLLTEAQAP